MGSKRFQCARQQEVSPEVSYESDVKELKNRETKWHATPGDREDYRQAALGLHPVSRCPTWLSGQEGHGNCDHRSQAASAADSDATTGTVRDLCGSAQGLRRHGSGESPGDTGSMQFNIGAGFLFWAGELMCCDHLSAGMIGLS